MTAAAEPAIAEENEKVIVAFVRERLSIVTVGTKVRFMF